MEIESETTAAESTVISDYRLAGPTVSYFLKKNNPVNKGCE